METSVQETPATAGVKTRQRCNWTAEEKAAWVADWEKCGKTMTEFCKHNDLPVASLSLWVKQLRGPTVGTSEPGTFVEIPAPVREPTPRPAGRECITIRLDERLHLEVPAGTDAVWLGLLLKNLS